VRSAAALALLAFVLAGCAKERPSALSIAACLRDHGATVRAVTFHYSPAGLHDDWTGVVFINYSKSRPATSGLPLLDELQRSLFGEQGLLIVARGDADARRLEGGLRRISRGELSIGSRGSVLYTRTPLSRYCL
jgi:hypothetical protein